MPFFEIQTSKNMDASREQEVLEKMTGFIAQALGKPERVVMVSLETGKNMAFGGSADPAALAVLKSIGLAQEKCPDLSAGICGFIETELDVPPDRVFIDFKNLDGKFFGWNSKTF